MRSCTLLLVVGGLAWSTAAFAEEPVDPSSAAGRPAAAEPVVAADAAADPMAADDAWSPDSTGPAEQDAAAQSAGAATDPMMDPTTVDDAPATEAAPSSAAGSAATDAPARPDADAAPGEAGSEMAQESAAPPTADAGSIAPAFAPATSASGKPLGPEAVDSHGHHGRIHTVVRGDTLWDISEAYLGTPWVWPSIWQDNGKIENPHIIQPGDRIWITAGEMRKVSHDEAAEMIAADNEEPADLAATDEPAEPSLEAPASEDSLMADDAPAAMDQLPVAVPLEPAPSNETGLTVRVVEREAMGFVSADAVEAATSIVDSPSPRTWLVDGDMIYLGLGEGRVAVGDEFTIFRDAEPVQDLDSGRLLGYHVDILGWAVVREVDGESSIAEIRQSQSESARGDRLIPRHAPPTLVPVKTTPEGIPGKIVFMPNSRTSMGSGDYVYLNRGALHGFEVGSEVEVYTPGRLKKDRATGEKVMTPDHVDARMVIVEVKPDTSVAYVVHTKRELEIGDLVRATADQVASR